MSTQQELDLEARLADMERQLAEMAAKVNPLYSGGMDRYIHSGYLQWDGINLRLDKNGIQLPADGVNRSILFFLQELAADPTAVLRKSQLIGNVSDSAANIIMAAATSGASVSAAVQANASSFLTYWTASMGGNVYQMDFQASSGSDWGLLTLTKGYLRIVGGSSDPAGAGDGSIWYNTTTGKLYARINGATKDLGGGGGLKTSGGGYYLIPAGPSIGTAVTSSASANTYGSWTEMRAASGNAIYILGVSVELPVNSTLTYVQIDIGTGGSGSETVVAQERVIGKRDNTNKYLYGNWHPEFMFPVPVPASTRIAVRVADNVASSLSHNITLHVIDQANLVSI